MKASTLCFEDQNKKKIRTHGSDDTMRCIETGLGIVGWDIPAPNWEPYLGSKHLQLDIVILPSPFYWKPACLKIFDLSLMI